MSEINSVTIPLKDYNSLRDFKTNVESGKIVIKSNDYHTTITYKTENEILKEIADKHSEAVHSNEQLRLKIHLLEIQVADANSEVSRLNTIINNPKKLSFWDWLVSKK